MVASTETETIKSAKKNHKCDWCCQQIDIGTGYSRWRCFEFGGASTVRLHPECYEAMEEMYAIDPDYIRDGWIPGFQRGCVCDDGKCDKCEARRRVK